MATGSQGALGGGRLLVLTADPSELLTWLSSSVQERVRVFEARDLPGAEATGEGLQLVPDDHPEAPEMVGLPMDGPLEALRLAAAHLAVRDPGVVVARPVGGRPPDPEQIGVLASTGLQVGVDLAACAWIDDAGLWIPGPKRVRRVDLDWTGRDSPGLLAHLLLEVAARGEETPASRWLAGVVRAGTRPSQAEWRPVVEASYIVAITELIAA